MNGITFNGTAARGTFLALLAAALVGCGPIVDALRETCTVVDTTTGEKRPATAPEIKAAARPAAEAAKTVLVNTGQPQWALFVDLGVKGLALALAYLIRPREQTLAAAVNGAPKTPAT